ncbi:MAG: cation:proton antiporter [Theionarchaea archaeon]|nr:cation:proton antiporter [Theionarchaea archaeon]MBU7020467.1 cation:proton antiporter [Theionarchaea archaeon]MBU7035673.1 cation:proton antiporter [Theionarchaea archaeon]
MELLIQIMLFLLMAKIGGELAERAKLPSVLGELLAGLVVGPSLLHLISPDPVMKDIAEIGIILLMFLAGLETNLDEMKRTGLVSLLAAMGGVGVPFCLAFVVGYSYGWNTADSLFLGAILTATSVGITVRTLMDIGKLNTNVGMTILGAAVIDDVIGIIVFTIVRGVALDQEFSILGVLELTVIMALFFIISIKAGFWVSDRLDSWVGRMRTQEVALVVAIIFVLFMAAIAERAQVAGITGAFIAGIVMSRSSRKESVESKINALGYGFFVPLFFVNIGVNTDLHEITMLGMAVLVVTVAIGGKILGSGIMALVGGLSLREALQVGIGMVPRLEVALIIASMGLTAGVISSLVYSLTVAMVLVTTFITPPLIKLVFK